MKRHGILALALAIAPWEVAQSQCADGSPPPCRSQAAAPARRPDPKLDDRAWIVVPFDNTSGSPDVEWLRTASVNLLYLSMSRWTDLRVVDDKRVADYMREVPGAADAKKISLSQAVAIAKRAGAGRLVMGDVLKLGARTTVNAIVFDVKTGQRVRTVKEETTVLDSLMPMYGKLSQKVLNIPAPVGSSSAIVGTTSVSAYQEYAEGMAALNKFELETALGHFNKSLALDSLFALPHARLAVLLGWLSPGLTSIRAHAEAAGRLSPGLPPREKALIDAQLAFSHQDYVGSCAGFRNLLKHDSTDTDAWYGLGDCLYHDPAMEPTAGDSAHPRFRGDRNASMRAFRTTLALDPTYHLAYQHLVDGLLQQSINGRFCLAATNCANYFAVFRPNGDSLIIEPVQLPRDSAAYRAQTEDLIRRNGRRFALEQALSTSDAWLRANPTEVRAKMMRGATYLTLGQVDSADAIMSGLTFDSTNAGSSAFMGALEVHLKRWRAKQALFLYDSLRAHPFTLRSGANPVTIGNVLTQIAPIYGQMNLFDSLVAIGSRGAPPSRLGLSRSVLRTINGMPADSLPYYFTTVFNEAVAGGAGQLVTRQLAQYLMFAWRSWPPSQWPKLDSTVTDYRSLQAVALQRGDTAALRRATRTTDSLSAALTRGLLPDSGLALSAAEGYLALRDSLKALTMTRRWLDTVVAFTPFILGQPAGNSQLLLPRAMLLRADLAAALGQRAEARLWYGRFLELWAKADPAAAPLLDRVRKALDALGVAS